MTRDRVIEQNSGVFLGNVESFKNARNESVSRVLVPRNYRHDSTYTSPKGVPMLELNETALEQEIRRVLAVQNASVHTHAVNSRMTVGGYEQMKMRLSPRHARLTNHDGHSYIRSEVDRNVNILNRLEQQVIGNNERRKKSIIKQNSFGLGLRFIETRKRSVQPTMNSDASLLSP